MLGNLTRLMAQYAQRHGLEHLLAAVHPRHVRFYQRSLGFQPLGKVKPHPAVRHRPSVALLLDLRRLEQERHPSYVSYFRESIPDEQLRYCPMSGADRRYFSLADSNCRPLPFIGAPLDQSAHRELEPQRASA
jgi:hypothetical protein